MGAVFRTAPEHWRKQGLMVAMVTGTVALSFVQVSGSTWNKGWSLCVSRWDRVLPVCVADETEGRWGQLRGVVAGSPVGAVLGL